MSAALSFNDMLDSAPMVGAPRAGSRRFWTMKELAMLRATYPVGGVPACLEVLAGRSARAIYATAGKLGLKAPVTEAREKHGMQRQRWTTSEHIDRAIREGYAKATNKAAIVRLAQAVGRPRWWVSKRAAALGLVTPRFRAPDWDAVETAIVEANAHRKPVSIARALKRAGYNRTETAVVVKLKRLGCDTQDPDHMTARGFAAFMGVDGTTVSGWITKGWLAAKRRGTERVAAQGGDQWWISRANARRFIIENAAAVDLRKVDRFWFIELLGGRS